MQDPGAGYPPQGAPYPPQGAPYPPQGVPYPPQGAPYPPQGSPYPPQGQAPPPGEKAYPPLGQAPPPAYTASPPPQGPPPAQVVVQTTVVSAQQYRDVPVNVQCPNCHNHVTSNLVFVNGALVWICVLVIAILFELWCGCCLIPLCIDGLKDVEHVCPVCSYKLGIYKRL